MFQMGRVRNKMVKRAARQMIERYYSRLTFDFDSNKRMADEVATTPTKRVRNKIAGFVTVSRTPIMYSELIRRSVLGFTFLVMLP